MKFSNQLNEALRQIPKGLPGKDKWGVTIELGYRELITEIKAIDNEIYNLLEFLDGRGKQPYNIKGLDDALMKAGDTLEILKEYAGGNFTLRGENGELPYKLIIDITPEEKRKLMLRARITVEAYEPRIYKLVSNIDEAVRHMPQDLPGEDKWGDIYEADLDDFVSRIKIATSEMEMFISGLGKEMYHDPIRDNLYQEKLIGKIKRELKWYPEDIEDLVGQLEALYDSKVILTITDEQKNDLNDLLVGRKQGFLNKIREHEASLNEAIRQIPKDLPGEDKWGEVLLLEKPIQLKAIIMNAYRDVNHSFGVIESGKIKKDPQIGWTFVNRDLDIIGYDNPEDLISVIKNYILDLREFDINGLFEWERGYRVNVEYDFPDKKYRRLARHYYHELRDKLDMLKPIIRGIFDIDVDKIPPSVEFYA